MKKLCSGLFAGVLVSQAALADLPATYVDGVIRIPGGAVIDEAGYAYYHDIELLNVGFGNFRIMAADRADLADVEMVNVIIEAQAGLGLADVVVEGTKPTPCDVVMDPAIALYDDQFVAVLPLAEPDEVCVQVIDDFEHTFQLNIKGLEPGTYTVVVNGVEADFMIEN